MLYWGSLEASHRAHYVYIGRKSSWSFSHRLHKIRLLFLWFHVDWRLNLQPVHLIGSSICLQSMNTCIYTCIFLLCDWSSVRYDAGIHSWCKMEHVMNPTVYLLWNWKVFSLHSSSSPYSQSCPALLPRPYLANHNRPIIWTKQSRWVNPGLTTLSLFLCLSRSSLLGYVFTSHYLKIIRLQ